MVIDQPPTDRQLIDAVIAGDPAAFRTFVERETPAVIATCRRIVGDPTEAEDAAQDAFVQAYLRLPTFRGDGPFGAWLRRIAVRIAVARLAARREVVRLDADALPPRAAALRSGDEPESRTLASERRAAVREAVATLPARHRDVILLRFYGEHSLQEISQITTQPLGTVKSRLHRGMVGLRHHLTRSAT